MGLIHAQLKLINLFNRKSVEINALVYNGTTFM